MWVCLFPYGWYCPGVKLQISVCLFSVILPSFRPTQKRGCANSGGLIIGRLKITSASTERQKGSQNFAPVLV